MVSDVFSLTCLKDFSLHILLVPPSNFVCSYITMITMPRNQEEGSHYLVILFVLFHG